MIQIVKALGMIDSIVIKGFAPAVDGDKIIGSGSRCGILADSTLFLSAHSIKYQKLLLLQELCSDISQVQDRSS